MDALKLSQLQFFIAIMEEGSVVGASRRMNCVASNITARIKELEQLLDQELFLREKGRLVVTPAARLFYREVRPVVSGASKLVHMFEGNEPRGLLTVGALDVALRHFIPQRLPSFATTFPGIQLTLLMRASYTLERMLTEGELDLILTDGPIKHPLLDSRFAFAENLSLVVPPHIAELEEVDWENTTVFLFNTDCFYRSCFERWLNGRGLEVRSIQTVESYDALRAYVAAGLGVSLFPQSMITASNFGEKAAFRAMAPADLPPAPVYFVWRREAFSTPVEHFIEHYVLGNNPI